MKFSFSIKHVHHNHTMNEASADLPCTELKWSDVTSPLTYSSSKVRVGVRRRRRREEDSDPQPEEVAYTPNLEMLHSSLEKEMDCSSGTLPRVRDREIGHIRWVSYDNGMLW